MPFRDDSRWVNKIILYIKDPGASGAHHSDYFRRLVFLEGPGGPGRARGIPAQSLQSVPGSSSARNLLKTAKKRHRQSPGPAPEDKKTQDLKSAPRPMWGQVRVTHELPQVIPHPPDIAARRLQIRSTRMHTDGNLAELPPGLAPRLLSSGLGVPESPNPKPLSSGPTFLPLLIILRGRCLNYSLSRRFC